MPSPESSQSAHSGTPLRLSVILPVLNEAAGLPTCFSAAMTGAAGVEWIVVDGGSTDASVSIALSFGVRVLVSPVAQRAAQMNLGAGEAGGDVLIFLHADTLLPAGWDEALRRALRHRPAALGGVFRRRFRTSSLFLRLTCRLADWRARRFGWFLGDQTIFVRRDAFAAAGGYHSLRAFEDLDFSLRLRRLGPSLVVPAVAMSSGRRFSARGPIRQTLADLRLTLRFLRDRSAFADPGSGNSPSRE